MVVGPDDWFPTSAATAPPAVASGSRGTSSAVVTDRSGRVLRRGSALRRRAGRLRARRAFPTSLVKSPMRPSKFRMVTAADIVSFGAEGAPLLGGHRRPLVPDLGYRGPCHSTA